MGIVQTVRRWFNMLFLKKAEDEFAAKQITSMKMDAFITKCMRIYEGRPDWVDPENDIKTINFAQSVCAEVARLSTLAIGIKIDGSAKADYLQGKINDVFYQIRDWVEYGCECGTVILKPNGEDIEVLTPDRFFVTSKHNGKIDGVVFHDQQIAPDGEHYYNKLEYHRFLENGQYAVDNKVYYANNATDTGKAINIEDSPWAGLEDITLENVERPLFGVLKMPGANMIDIDSPLGMPIFASALQELQDLDIAYSRNAAEILDSQRTVLLDSDRLIMGGTRPTEASREQARKRMKLPRFVKNVEGTGSDTFYQEINPQLNTPTRLDGINNMLSLVGYKCGFSNGYFVLDQKTGMVTATQVESDDRRTIQLIKDVRDKLEDAMKGVIYALSVFADLYDLAPAGEYNEDAMLHFGDITYNYAEDKATWWAYVQAGKAPAWMYFVKFENMSEEEAKQMLAELEPSEEQLNGVYGNGAE